MTDSTQDRGVLFPDRLPAFTRLSPEPALAPAVRWFWVARWELPDGTSSVQEVLPFAAANLTVEPTGVSVSGPISRVSARVLEGSGWVLAANLQPAVSADLLGAPRAMRDRARAIEASWLVESAARSLRAERPFHEAAREGTAALGRWIERHIPQPREELLRANHLLEAIERDAGITTLRQAADALHVSPRTAQRIAHDAIGLSVGEIIRRSRLQRALADIRADPTRPLAHIAAENGYADHAHLAAELRGGDHRPARVYRDAIIASRG